MNIGELLFLVFCSIAVVNVLFMTIYVWLQRERNTIPSLILCTFFIIVAERIVKLLLHDLKGDFGLNINFTQAYFLLPTIALIGPLLHFYIRSVSLKSFKFQWPDILHLIPFTIIFLLLLAVYSDTFRMIFSNYIYSLHYLITTIILIQPLVYIIYSFRYSSVLIKNSKECNSPKENINPYWIRNIVFAISLIWILDLMYSFEAYTKINTNANTIEPIFYSFFIFYMLFLELRYKRITFITNFTSRLKSSILPIQEILRYKSILLDYIKEKEVYKDHDITLGRLAKELSMTPHLLSQIINEQFSCNFNDFINSYRIEEAKLMLADKGKNNFTIASIAYDCGFNTLSAFNTAFKKFTGLTPSQFRAREK